MEPVLVWASYLAIGVTAGLLAGLLGVGGGLIVVPGLVFLLQAQGAAPQHIMHLALGTSMAVIIFTSASSLYAHHRRGAVAWPVVAAMAPGIIIGGCLGASLASLLSTFVLKLILVVFLYLVAAQIFLGVKPKPTRTLPGPAGVTAVGGVIGGVSALAGIGGGSMSVPFLLWCNTPVHRAVGTSAALGLPIALGGAAGYVAGGWGAPALPSFSAGFVHLPALAGITLASMALAPAGAKLAHTLKPEKVKRVFALFVAVVATRLMYGLFQG